MDAYGVRRKDTTKGPPLRVLSLGKFFILHLFGLPVESCTCQHRALTLSFL